MLDPEEARAVAEQFGVALAQAHRDHLISHLLAALSEHIPDRVLFFGGTALSRTFAPDGRLSEDIDLIAFGNRREVAEAIEQTLARATRREYPGIRLRPSLNEVRDVEPAILTTPEGIAVRIQLLRQTGYARWPTERRRLVQRYSDAPPATLIVPTLASFAAWKTTAWVHRTASRDLYDLWLLARIGAMTAEAAELFRAHGPTNQIPSDGLFATPPDETTWRRELAGQTRLHVTAAEALSDVRAAWRNAVR
jgi:predicted nucleotidyltransferase component of viral defense system